LILILVLCSQYTIAQDVNGFWKGSLTMRGGCFPENNIELQITIKGESVTGDSYHYLDANNYIRKELKGIYYADANKLVLQEGEVITYNIPFTCVICVKKFELYYSKTGNVEMLSGGWTGKILGTGNDCQPGTITLSRIKESLFKGFEFPEIHVDTGEIRLDFYDNGSVDGDSISVTVNKQTVLSHQKLSAKAITAFIRIDPQLTVQEVMMIAENLGSIPPNTAVLMITAGKERYQLYLTSTEQRSAKVRFVYRKPDK
jgi:hypothetical protein